MVSLCSFRKLPSFFSTSHVLESASLNASQYGLAISIPAVSLFAISLPSIPESLSEIPSTAFIPICERTSKAGVSLLPMVSFNPSTACPTVLASVASLENDSFVPTFEMASKKSSVLIFPSCTALTISCVDMPISLATAAIPAGDCSSISLKSSHATLGFAAICVACWDNVFIACCGFSAAAAKPPKPFTSCVVFFVPTAASCE